MPALLLPPAMLRPVFDRDGGTPGIVSKHAVRSAQRSIDSALSHGVSRFVYYSVMHPLRRAVRHHRLKLDAVEALIESGLPYTIVHPMRYIQHLALIWNKVLETAIHASPFSIDSSSTSPTYTQPRPS